MIWCTESTFDAFVDRPGDGTCFTGEMLPDGDRERAAGQGAKGTDYRAQGFSSRPRASPRPPGAAPERRTDGM